VKLTELKDKAQAERPWVRYQFVDPALEGLSSGQKILLRVGPDNRKRLENKLLEIRRHVTDSGLASL
jgi:hypothetical protein